VMDVSRLPAGTRICAVAGDTINKAANSAKARIARRTVSTAMSSAIPVGFRERF
jgi:hypothetical protein